ncbi:ribonuclease E/G [Methylocapsa acidiphila]|uniref:ribonuclease E/G n=1 Tax=Methylocapsa acidiphila TaxID=133552 RepID=UPI0003FA89CA|nr:ribonuclease E/G [Methylocapsa acidiphila]
MANKMLIDASHPEETRVVVLRGNRVEEFDFESASKKQLRGNIYLAKVTRVEPSLQAAFVDYGGNRHGFLAFSEIHPDYYQIPVVDRQALIDEDARAQRDEDEEESRSPRRSRRFRRGDRNGRRSEKRRDDETLSEPFEGEAAIADQAASATLSDERAPSDSDLGSAPEEADQPGDFAPLGESGDAPRLEEPTARGPIDEPAFELVPERSAAVESLDPSPLSPVEDQPQYEDHPEGESRQGASTETVSALGEVLAFDRRVEPEGDDEVEEEEEHVEQLGGDAMEEVPVRPQRYRKQYKIQEVIKRRQVLLVQVVKEERGNKGAALTTYLSLAGRYSVLMPNTARGGGISRKITDSTDRQRLKAIAQELEVPEGMGVILRTAGAARSKAEVKRDFEYLLRMWETVRETTLRSTAPTLVYEEGSLIKRAIRDLYTKEIDEIVVAGENGYREAKEFMRLLMPSHAKSVQPYRDAQPLFAKSGVEAQLDAMFSNQVTLKSGGYIVINQTEALVAIDVNSGRSTREHNIEDTALRTNLEACDEIARQLRLRDLAGLIVLDLIDMEENRNNRAVERRLKEALKNDRARIQVGRISHFGLLEMSRQRIRTGVLEGSTVLCPHCVGAGMVRSTSSIALYILRVLEDALIKSASYDLIIKTRTEVALYILNQKRAHLRELEKRFGAAIIIGADDSLTGSTYYALERGELAVGGGEVVAFPRGEAPAATLEAPADIFFVEDDEEIEANGAAANGFDASADAEPADEAADQQGGESEADARRRRRRRRRRGRGGDREGTWISANAPQPPDDALEAIARIGGLQTPIPAAEAEAESELAAPLELSSPDELGSPRELDSPDEVASQRETAGVEPASVANEEPQRPRRGGRRAREAEPAEFAPAPEAEIAQGLAAESEPELEAKESGVETAPEPAPQKSARRGRRAPRAPRGAAREAEAPAPIEASAWNAAAAEGPDGQVSISTSEPELFDAAPIAPAEPSVVQNSTAAPEASALTESTTTEADRLEPQAPPQPTQEESARPKRSGWWQRAKASFRA